MPRLGNRSDISSRGNDPGLQFQKNPSGESHCTAVGRNMERNFFRRLSRKASFNPRLRILTGQRAPDKTFRDLLTERKSSSSEEVLFAAQKIPVGDCDSPCWYENRSGLNPAVCLSAEVP